MRRHASSDSADPRPGTTRRRLLGTALIASVGYGLLGRWSDEPPERAVERFLVILSSALALPDPIRVGKAFLRLDPWNNDPDQLLDAALGALPLDTARTTEDLVDAFEATFRRDFEQGAIVKLDGWFVSRTEGAFCALLAIDSHHGELMPVG
ncbi:MAG: hypothetical protein AAGE94_15645 [Acidobacteriota bacterium]